jgi:hypothetical protein
LKKDGEIIKDIFGQIEREINPRNIFSRGMGPPSSFL